MKNNKGFTLIEVIVSIAVGSISLVVIGSLLINSISLYMNVSYSDIDKRALDSIVSFIREEVEYSTDVRLMSMSDENAPVISDTSKWHRFYVSNGVLYRDNEQLYSNSFYNSKTLAIQAKGNYENQVRVDLSYQLNQDDEEVYTSRDTLVLLNVTVSDTIKNYDLFDSRSNVALTNENSEQNKDYALYYIKDITTINNNTDSSTDTDDTDDNDQDKEIAVGTVAALENNINVDNSRGYFNSALHYNKGDYVYYNGYWWMKNSDINNNSAPGEQGSSWERVDQEYKVGENTSYLKDDIVIYEGKYYQCVVDSYAFTNPGLCANPPVSSEDNQYYYQWKIITEEEAKQKTYEKVYNYDVNLVIKKYLPSDVKVSDINPSSIPLYDATKMYKKGSIVKMEIENTGYYQKFYKLFDDTQAGLAPNVVPENGWILIENDYSAKSAYAQGDYIIGYNGSRHNDEFIFYVPKINILVDNDETLNILKSVDQWGTFETPYSQYIQPQNNSTQMIDAFWTIINGY